MKRTIMIVLAVFLVIMGCGASNRFQVRDFQDFQNQKKALQEKKIMLDRNIAFYHDVEKKEDRMVVKGEPDTTPEYVELSALLGEELIKQLTVRGFVLVGEDGANIMKLKIYGFQDDKYTMLDNKFIGVIADVSVGQEILLSHNFGIMYNIFFTKEKQVKDNIVPKLVETLEATLDGE